MIIIKISEFFTKFCITKFKSVFCTNIIGKEELQITFLTEFCKHTDCSRSENFSFITIKLCKESMEETLITLTNSTYCSNIWINDKIFDMLIFESIVWFTAIKVWKLFPKHSQKSIRSHIPLIFKEVLNIGSSD